MKNEKEVTAMFEKLEGLNLERSTSTNGKKQLYKFPDGMFKQDQKTFRRKTRNLMSNILFNIARKNQKFGKTKQISQDSIAEINNFEKLYKERYLVHDYSLNSIREKIDDPNEQTIFESALVIIQHYKGTTAKK